MSHSGSHTPTNNPTISNIINPQSTVSRPQILDDVPSAELLIEDLGRPPVTPPSLEPPIAESSSKRRTASESSTEKPMAKRIRRESPEPQDRASRHDSSSSEMQDDVESAKRPEPQASNPTPPKKKRTRTLTTPQQFAVLQALLAKSRFPTTAMREDVGRSIGLSARKVQIWFQNQRQKARRPRSQSDTPLTRPPQYGPFPNVPGPSSSSRGFEEYPPARMTYTAQSAVPEVRPQASQPDIPPRLLGPGMPGPSVYAPHPYQPIAGPSTSAIPIESRFPGSHPPRRSESPQYYHSRSPRAPSHTSVRYPTSQPSHWHRRERDPLRTLPPLVPSSSYSTRRTHAPSSSLPSRLTHGFFPYPTSPEPRFRHVSPEISSRPSINLPPPFAMQPSPQWNPTAHPTPFRSDQRHISSLWSRRDSRSTTERSIPTVTTRLEGIVEVSTTDPPPEGHHHLERGAPPPPPPHSTSLPSMPPSSSSLPPSRLGRYDPVRATFVTRSTPTPTAPQARSPAQQSGEDNEEEINNNKDRKTPISPKEDR